jgi:predicted deacetylase
MSAKYIIRFDDFCPTMNWALWDQIEPILLKHGIKPIIAVVPDNNDPTLTVNAPRADFWEKVRSWQAAGWTIALHGYQHLYSTPDPGLMKINSYSEFAGLPYQEQRDKLEKGLAIFAENQISVQTWIAPAHAFDANTVKALLDLQINVISDGYYFRPVKRLGALWVPQQIWRLRPMRSGLWTVCLHSNDFSEADIKKFARDIEKYAPAIITFDQAIRDFPANEVNILDYAMEQFWHISLRFKHTFWPFVYPIKKLLRKYDPLPN